MSSMCYRCLRESVEGGRCTACGAPAVRRSPAENDNRLPLGTRLDNGSVIVGDSLGSGGFGITYLARDLYRNRLIALKEFMPQYMISGRRGLNLRVIPEKQQVYEKSLASFCREARIINEMHHPNIVRVLFEMSENNTAYYGMELLEGEDLRKWSKPRIPMKPAEAVELLVPIMDALIYIHEKKRTLHRDISPDNIFIRKDERYASGISPCLIDFGAAYSAMKDFTQTMPGVKKSGFSPLEQNWSQDKLGSFTDVYAFTANLYFLLTGKVPVPSNDRQLVNDPLERPGKLNRHISPEVEGVLLQGLALRPSDRIQDMRRLRQMLCAATGVSPVPPKPAVEKPRFEANPEPQPRPEPVVKEVHVRGDVNWDEHVQNLGGSGGKNGVAPQPHPMPTPPPVPQPSPQPAPVVQPQKRSALMLLATLLDWILLIGVPVAALFSYSPAVAVGAGFGLMFIINTLLCCMPNPGTLGQRMLQLHVKADGGSAIGSMLAYNLLRLVVPFALVDEIFAAAGVLSPSVIERICGVHPAGTVAAADDAAANPESVYESQPIPSPKPQNNHETPSVVWTPAPQPVRPSDNPSGNDVPPARLVCRAGVMQGRAIKLERRQTMGRSKEFSTIPFPEKARTVSHKHCILYYSKGEWLLQDVGSSNGTHVNGRRLDNKPCRLRNNDVVKMGEEEFIFQSK